jgi:hypothetical protein
MAMMPSDSSAEHNPCGQSPMESEPISPIIRTHGLTEAIKHLLHVQGQPMLEATSAPRECKQVQHTWTSALALISRAKIPPPGVTQVRAEYPDQLDYGGF